MDPAIPIIDISPFLPSSSSSSVLPSTTTNNGKLKVASEIKNACQSTGIFFIAPPTVAPNSSIPKDIFKASKNFFNLPNNVKNEYANAYPDRIGFTRGYLGLGTESGSKNLTEVKEAFSYGYEWDGRREIPNKWNGLQGLNVWPSMEKGHINKEDLETMKVFYNDMVNIAESLRRALSVGIVLLLQELDPEFEKDMSMEDMEGYLERFCSFSDNASTTSLMRLFHYFPQQPNSPNNLIGSSPHSDWGFLTLILQDSIGGLQLLKGNGEWLSVPTHENTLVVNCGDFTSLLTRGLFKSPMHRVTLSNSERYSMVFFYYPDYEALLQPIVTEKNVARNGADGYGQDYSLLRDQSQDADNKVVHSNVTMKKEWESMPFGEFILHKWAQVSRTK